MWEYVIGGATIFGAIVGLFSVYNGGASRKVIIEEERRMQEILKKLSDQHSAMIDVIRSIQPRAT